MKTRSMSMGQSLALFALIGALEATGLLASDPWAWANVNFNGVPTNTQPPTSSPVPGTISTNLSVFGGLTGSGGPDATLLVQSSLGDPTYGLTDKPLVMTHTNNTAATSFFDVFLSSSLNVGTLPTSGVVHVSWDYVATEMGYWGPTISLKRGDPSYAPLFSVLEFNNGPDLRVTTASGPQAFANVLTLGQATHFDVLLNLDNNNMVFSFNNHQTNVSFSSYFANTNNSPQVGYFIAEADPTHSYVFGVDNILIIPEPQTMGLVAAALGGLLGFARFCSRATPPTR